MGKSASMFPAYRLKGFRQWTICQKCYVCLILLMQDSIYCFDKVTQMLQQINVILKVQIMCAYMFLMAQFGSLTMIWFFVDYTYFLCQWLTFTFYHVKHKVMSICNHFSYFWKWKVSAHFSRHFHCSFFFPKELYTKFSLLDFRKTNVALYGTRGVVTFSRK